MQDTQIAGVMIREALPSELQRILDINVAAFGSDIEAGLVRDLLDDPSAKPTLSLLALRDSEAIGHILFSAVQLTAETSPPPMSILAPLSVIPEAQSQGIGAALIKAGLEALSKAGTALVFVLGHPDYYSRHGFEPAGRLGFEAPFPIAEEHQEAWMVQALKPNAFNGTTGRLACADSLNKPEYWQE